MSKLNKFHLFALLVFAGAVNLILLNLYKEQFRRTMNILPKLITRHWVKSNAISIVRLPLRTAKTVTDIKAATKHSTGNFTPRAFKALGKTVWSWANLTAPWTTAKNSTGNFIPRALKALGKTVWSRANLTAPWATAKNSTGNFILGALKALGKTVRSRANLTAPWATAKNSTGNFIPRALKALGKTVRSRANLTVPRAKAKNSTDNFIPRALKALGKTVWPRANLTAPWDRKNNSAPLCPLVPPKLVGRLSTFTSAPNLTDIVRLNPRLEPGGHYQPSQCRARHRVAIIVPYRNRYEHLRVLLHNLHPMLIRQQLDYFILVVELAHPTRFNRAMLLNIGAVEAGGLWDVQCFIFHDVDLVPEDDRNLYTCPQVPRHMSAAINKFGYRLPYPNILGGVTAITREHFYRINGYSNQYFGWGGEDDDLNTRVRKSGLNVTRYPMDIARYRMIKHRRDEKNEPNPKRFALLRNVGERQLTDGLNSLEYRVNKLEFRPAYTWIQVSINEKRVMKSEDLKNEKVIQLFDVEELDIVL